MGVFEHFPYTNYHELNISWILRKLKELEEVIGTQIVDLVARAGVAENAQAISDLTDTVEANATTAHNEAAAAQTAAAAAQTTAETAQTSANSAASAASAAQSSANTANTALARRGVNIKSAFQINADIPATASGVDAFYDPYTHTVYGSLFLDATDSFNTAQPMFTITNVAYRPTETTIINGIVKTTSDVVFPFTGAVNTNGSINQTATASCKMAYFSFFYQVA